MTEAELSEIEARANENATPCDVIALVGAIRQMRTESICVRRHTASQLWRFLNAIRITRSIKNSDFADGIEYALNILSIERPADMEWRG